MEVRLPFGRVHGFIFVLAWSRYLFVRFYPRESMEFFLAGHEEAYLEIGGAARQNWYDNLKSVVTTRRPLTFNAQFIDYMRHMGVAVHACNPGKGNEKGRVERAIRDIRSMVEAHDFIDIHNLNTRVDRWRKEWNLRIHRSTRRTPASMRQEESLLPLPAIPYRPYRVIQALVGKTAFVECDTNRYSVPTIYANRMAVILAYADHLEVVVEGRKIASHERAFGKHEKIEHPSHRETLLDRTPNGKHERIYHLMKRMGSEADHFLAVAESEGEDALRYAYGLFCLLRHTSKVMLLSAIREACAHHVYKLRYIAGLLGPKNTDPTVYPQNASLLDISYTTRELTDYDNLA
jgi:hypothetical protein